MGKNELCMGLCGRCGVLGDHFDEDCPRLVRRSVSGTLYQESPSASFTRFLDRYKLSHMETRLKAHGITEFEQLFDPAHQKLRASLCDNGDDHNSLEFAQTHCKEVFSSLSGQSENEHWIFLSHFKFEAGTEAALQQELERLIHETNNDDTVGAHVNIGAAFSLPVFLDSEDLQDLADLKKHVEKSHNLALLLTTGVLRRPWVLIEIVAAMRAGVRVIPVEIQRRGRAFQYPTAAYI